MTAFFKKNRKKADFLLITQQKTFQLIGLQSEIKAVMIKIKLTIHIRQNSEIKSYPFIGIEKSKKNLVLKFQNQVQKFTMKHAVSITM